MAIKKFKCLSCGNKTGGVITDQNFMVCPRCGDLMIVIDVVGP